MYGGIVLLNLAQQTDLASSEAEYLEEKKIRHQNSRKHNQTQGNTTKLKETHKAGITDAKQITKYLEVAFGNVAAWLVLVVRTWMVHFHNDFRVFVHPELVAQLVAGV